MPKYVHASRLVQMTVAADAATNLAKAEAAIADAAKAGAQIVCLPELFTGYYFCQKEDAACSTSPSRSPARARNGSRLRRRRTASSSSARSSRQRMPGVYHNTATVHDADGKLLGIYRKMHIPDDPLYLEKFYFTPGDLGFKVLRHEVTPRSARSSAGTSGIPRRRGSRHCRGRR